MYLKSIKKILCIVCFIGIFTFLLAFNVKASENITINYLTASVGETYDKVGINYHTSHTGSYVEYGTSFSNNSIINPESVNPTESLWEYYHNDTLLMPERYVCKANLTNLEAGTKYYYQVVNGDTKSEIQSFTTATNNASEKTFFFLTDIQSEGSAFKNPETLLQAMLSKTKNENPGLIVMTGDQVDEGSDEQQWIDYHKYVTSLDNFVQATLPGNHEYYSDGTNITTNEVYNHFYNNPTNGPADRIGSSYYFVWDQILFIMLDTYTSYNLSAQKKWFKEVVKNNPAQWIIVGSHPGLYATGAYASDAQKMRNNWMATFQECQVDLALNGHEHVYARVNTSYNGATDEKLGVTYLAGAAAGLKNYGGKADADLLNQFTYYDKTLRNAGVAITVNENQLVCKLYNSAGEVLDEFSLLPKRPASVTPMSDQEILDSFEIAHDSNTNDVTLSWSENLYGNIKSFTVTGGRLIAPYEHILNTNNINSKTWVAYYPEYNFDFKISITKNDDTILEKEIRLLLNPSIADYNIIYDLDGGINHPDNPNKFNGQDLPIDLSTYLKAPTKEGYDFKGWIVNKNTRPSNNIPDNTYSDVTLKAVWEKSAYKITYELDGGENNVLNPSDFRDGDLPISLYPPKKTNYVFAGWELNGEIVTEIPNNLSSSITLVAKWEEKEFNINYSLQGGSLDENAKKTYTNSNRGNLPTPTKKGYNFLGWELDGEIVNEIPENYNKNAYLKATWEKAKGCKKNAVYEVMLGIAILSASLIIFRKKH